MRPDRIAYSNQARVRPALGLYPRHEDTDPFPGPAGRSRNHPLAGRPSPHGESPRFRFGPDRARRSEQRPGPLGRADRGNDPVRSGRSPGSVGGSAPRSRRRENTVGPSTAHSSARSRSSSARVSEEERLAEYLRQMIVGSRDAISFLEGMDRASFLSDLRTQRAVVMSLLIVGEAATRVVAEFPGFAGDRSDIPWRSIRGMRNRIAHGYFDIDLGVVWQTVTVQLPELVERLESGPNDADAS